MPMSFRVALAATFVLLSAGAACAQQAGTANLDRVEVAGRKTEVSPWFSAESPHFVVYSDTREEDVAPLLDNLEKLDRLLRAYLLPAGPAESQAEPPASKLTLYYHASLSGLRAVPGSVPVDAVGLYTSCAEGAQGFGVHLERMAALDDEQLEKAPLNDSLTPVFEAYARHFLYRHTDIRSPAWFIDGFAQYFSSVRFSAQQTVVGRAPRDVAGYLRFLGAGRKYHLEWEDVLAHRLADAHGHGGEAGARLEFQAKSWLLTHYALSSDDNRKRLSRYLRLVGDGASPTAAFERAFGLTSAALGPAMWRYGQRGMEVLRGAPQSLPPTQIRFRTLTRGAGEFVLVDAALRSCPGRQAGESLLKEASELAARFPEDRPGRLTWSRAQIDWGDPQAALSRLEADLRDEDTGFEARYLAGRAHLSLAGRSEGVSRAAHLQAARQYLQRALALNPRSPEVALAGFKAEVAAADTPDDAAFQGVIAVWQAARDVDALTRFAALAYALTGKADEAYQALGTLAQNGEVPAAMAQWAREWQGRLETGVTRGELLAELRRTDVPDVPVKEWTLNKRRVLQKVELSAGLEAADAFIKDRQQQSDGGPPPGNAAGGAGRR
jgi:hypothetical protein